MEKNNDEKYFCFSNDVKLKKFQVDSILFPNILSVNTEFFLTSFKSLRFIPTTEKQTKISDSNNC